jgi:hypothetical protein
MHKNTPASVIPTSGAHQPAQSSQTTDISRPPAKTRVRPRVGPAVGGLARVHKPGCEATDPLDCECPIEIHQSLKGKSVTRSARTSDWLEAQRQLREMVTQSAEDAGKETAWVQRGLAKSLARLGAETVKIPRTAARASQRIFAKLLTRVDPDARWGSGFEGTVVKPGDQLPLTALWPTPEHPRIPVLLECAGAAHPRKGPGRQKDEDIYLLWRFDVERSEWREIARASSTSWDWAIDLRQIATRLLEESRGADAVVYPGLEQWIDRMRAALGAELKQLAPPDRFRAVAATHDLAHFAYQQFVLGTIISGDRAQTFVELAPTDV